MRWIFIWVIGCAFSGVQLGAQVSWFGGGALASSPRIRSNSGSVGLQAVCDHYWQVGVGLSPLRRAPTLSLGLIGSFQLRSIFYELDKPLPYYPLKPLVPAFRLEAIQVWPFLSWTVPIPGVARMRWGLRSGPVFSIHGGNYSSVTTARTISGDVPFQLYRLGVYRHPIGLPFIRSQVMLSYSIRLRNSLGLGLQPFFQFDVGDRSRVWYQTIPEDPLFASAGWIRNGIGAMGLSCSLTRTR